MRPTGVIFSLFAAFLWSSSALAQSSKGKALKGLDEQLLLLRSKPDSISQKERAPEDDDDSVIPDDFPEDADFLSRRGRQLLDDGKVNAAITYLNVALRLDPKHFDSLRWRGWARTQKGEFKEAISDLDEAIGIDAEDRQSFRLRAFCWSRLGESDKAISDYTEALRLFDQDAFSYHQRAVLFAKRGEYEKAVADFTKGIRSGADACNDYAWFLATCPDKKYRDGPQAVKLARMVCASHSWKAAATLDTLAAAYAETGDFERAIKYQTKAIESAPKDNKDDFRSRLDLYKSGRPCRDEPR